MLSYSHRFFLISIVAILLVSALAVLFYENGVAQMLKGGWKFFPNNIFEKWLPASVLIGISIFDHRFIAVLLLHLALFNYNFYVQLWGRILVPLSHAIRNKLLGAVALSRIISAALINHCIYYAFLLFGIDLRKEHSSAFSYLKKLRRR
jgi:hypothetical protein